MRKFNILSILMTCVFFIAFHANAQEQTIITAVNVAEISEADPDTDQDDADLMIQSVAGGTFQSFIMFDIGAVNGKIGSAGVKFYMAQHEEKSNAGLITPARVMLLPVDNTDWDNAVTWNTAKAMGLINKDNYALEYINAIDYNKTHLNGKDSKWYYASNALISNYINQKVQDGADKVAFALVAMDSIPQHDIWTGGTWRTPELILTKSDEPVELSSVDYAELMEATPDDVTADAGDLQMQKTTNGQDKFSLVKFDLSPLSGKSVENIVIQVYGAQHNDVAGMAAMDEYMIEVYEANSNNWTAADLTYNVFNASVGHQDVGVAEFDMNNANNGVSNLRGIKSKIISSIRLTELVNTYLAEGKTEISLVFKAGTVNDDFDAWFGGTWRSAKMYAEQGDQPLSLTAIADGEVDSSAPDTPNPDSNAGDLRMQRTSGGNIVRSYIKFDVSELDANSIKYAKIEVYGAQHENDNPADRYLIDLFGVDNVDKINGTSLTYNISETFSHTEKALGRLELPLNAVNNKVSKYQDFDQFALTEFIKEKINAGAGEVGFALMANEEVDYDAYIGGVAWKAPRLVVTTIPSVTEEIEMELGQVINVTEDSWVGEKDEYTNHDGETDMNVTTSNGDTRQAYLKFDISKSTQADIVSIVLKGAQKDGDGWTALDNFEVEIYGADDNSWAEAGLIWANKPEITTEALASLDITVTSSDLFEFKGEALTEFINSKIQAGDEYATLVVAGKNNTSGSRVWFSDKSWVPPTMNFTYEVSSDVQSPEFDKMPGLFAPPSVEVQITGPEGAELYYSIDGSAPTKESTPYSEPIVITEDMGRILLQAAAYSGDTRSYVTAGEFLIGSQQPYEEAFPVPGSIEAWKFDLGGLGVSYFESNDKVESCSDKTSIQSSRSDNATIDGCCDDGRCDIGWGAAGEWTEYTVSVNGTNCFTAVLRYLKALDGPAKIQIDQMDDNNNVIKNLIPATDVPQNTDSWEANPYDLSTLTFTESFELEDGEHVIRVTWVEDQWNFTELELYASDACTGTSSLSHKKSESFHVYPNPVSHTLNIEFENVQTQTGYIRINDINGRELYFNDLTHSMQHQIDVSNFESGLYFVSYLSKDGLITKQISVVN